MSAARMITFRALVVRRPMRERHRCAVRFIKDGGNRCRNHIGMVLWGEVPPSCNANKRRAKILCESPARLQPQRVGITPYDSLRDIEFLMP